ncbi:MAG: FKBP-type peptidyl-prolyl cis-trans isomerase [Bryobacteraceae bacterium]|jgi:FKBP-type peptidyl-prolyl cis-trans isomerase FkpA
MRRLLIVLPAVLMAQTPAPKPDLATDDEKAIYSLGLTIHRSLAPFELSARELEILMQGIRDAAAGKPALDLKQWEPKVGQLTRERTGRAAEKEKAAGKAYLEKAAAEPGAVKTGSGLVYRELKAGTGASPAATDKVKVHYRGTFVNGTEFDSSYRRNEPAQFPLNGVIRCWTEGVQKMKAGGKSVLVCPSDLAYGDRGRPPIPGGATLVFEIELLEVVGATGAATK